MNQIYIAAAIAVISFGAGWTTNGWRYEANEKASYEAAIEKANKASSALETAISELEKNKFIVQREVRHEIEKPVYHDCLLPASGLQLYNDSVSGKPNR